jgi:L-arabinokinase
LPLARPLALSSFGGYGVHDLDVAALDCLGAWDVVMTGHTRPANLPGSVHFFEEGRVYDAGLRYEDLVAASDAVVTKPGYGIVSECVANETAIVYTSRGRFAEYPVLVEHIERWLKHAFLEPADLRAGRWHDALERARAAPSPLERPATIGAHVIADMILALCSADVRSSGPLPPP